MVVAGLSVIMDGAEIRSWSITSMRSGVLPDLPVEVVFAPFPVMVVHITYIRLGDQTHLLLTVLKVSDRFIAPGHHRIRPAATTPSLSPTTLMLGRLQDMVWEAICRLRQYY